MLNWAQSNCVTVAALAEAAACSDSHLRNIFAGRKKTSLALAARLSAISHGAVPIESFVRPPEAEHTQ
jgi:hypothetical protein